MNAPNLTLNLQLEPIIFWWNGRKIILSGKYQLIPDNQVRHLHKRVLCTARDRRPRGTKIPFYGTVIGCAKYYTEYIYIVQDEYGEVEKVRNPKVIE